MDSSKFVELPRCGRGQIIELCATPRAILNAYAKLKIYLHVNSVAPQFPLLSEGDRSRLQIEDEKLRHAPNEYCDAALPRVTDAVLQFVTAVHDFSRLNERVVPDELANFWLAAVKTKEPDLT